MSLRSTAISSAAELWRPSSGASGAALEAGAIDSLTYYADPAGVPGARKAAKATEGDTVGSYVWGFTATFEMACTVIWDGTAATSQWIMGGGSSLMANFDCNATGRVGFRNGGSTKIRATDGLVPGVPTRIHLSATATSATLTVGGVAESATFAEVLWSTTGNLTAYIGAQNTTGLNRFHGLVYDVAYVDPDTSANSRLYRLDGSFEDSLGNGTDIAAGNWVQWEHINTPGAAAPVPVFSPAVTELQDASFVRATGTTSGEFGFSALQDDFGRRTGAKVSVSADSWVSFDASFVATLDTLGGSGQIDFWVRSNTGVQYGEKVELVLGSVGDARSISMSGSWYQDVDTDITLRIDKDTLDAWTMTSASFTVLEQRV